MNGPLIDELFERPWDFNFFQAVALLELSDPFKERVGDLKLPEREAVRFCSLASIGFPPSDVYSLDPEIPAGDRLKTRPPLLTVAFLGLTGPNGALPLHYTELMLEQGRYGRGPEKTALRDWFDLFNHRLISQHYRAGEKYRFVQSFNRYLRRRSIAQGNRGGRAASIDTSIIRTSKQTEHEPFTLALMNLVGVGSKPLRNRLRVDMMLAKSPGEDDDRMIDRQTLVTVDDLAVLYYAGLFAQRPRNASGVAALVGNFFGQKVEVQQFSGQWLDIPKDQQVSMGVDAFLGMNTIAGDRVWDVSSSFRLRIGPLTLKDFQNLLPDKGRLPWRKLFFLLCQLVRLYVGPEYDFEVQLVLSGPEVPECQLKNVRGTAMGACLGWNTWLKVGPMPDVDDVMFPSDETTAIPADE